MNISVVRISRFSRIFSFFLLSFLFVMSRDTFAVRGRVHMQDGLLLTDYNTILRGVNIVAGARDQVDDNTPNRLRTARDEYGLNCLHIYGMDYQGGGVTSDLIKTNTDRLVAWCGELDMYVVIVPQCEGGTLHCFDRSPTEMWSIGKRFWDWMAPRYKDETHVIYEWQNEPRTTPDWMASDQRNIQNQVDGFNLLRGYAPETHIMMWDFSGIRNNWNQSQADIAWNLVNTPGIDFSNASIGLHCGPEIHDPNNPFRKFVDRMRAADRAWTATETEVCADGSEYGKWWCPLGFEVFRTLDGMNVGWLSFHHLFNITPQWKSMMNQYGPKWNPDFGNWPLEQAPRGNIAVARVHADTLEGKAPLEVTFDASRCTGEGLTYSWDFGNGETSDDDTVSTIFEDVGTYVIRLIVENDSGDIDTAFDTVSVYIDAPFVIQAEEYDLMEGVEKQGDVIVRCDENDWTAYNDIDFKNGYSLVTMRYSVDDESAGQEAELRLDSQDGTLVGVLTLESTGGWDLYKEISGPLEGAEGAHDLYLVFKGTEGRTQSIGNFDWMRFWGAPEVGIGYKTHKTERRKVQVAMSRGRLRLVNAALAGGGRASIVDAHGRVVVESDARKFQSVPLDNLAQGAYIVRVKSRNADITERFIISR